MGKGKIESREFELNDIFLIEVSVSKGHIIQNKLLSLWCVSPSIPEMTDYDGSADIISGVYLVANYLPIMNAGAYIRE